MHATPPVWRTLEIAAAADIYDSRLDRMKELYPGIATTRDYR